jgi:hypothetical protein
MRKIANCFIALVAVTLQAGTCLAQNSEQTKFYKLEFVVKEVEAGKVLNARAYSITASNLEPPSMAACTIRTGSKVPTPITSSGAGGMNFTFLDVGVSIDCYSIRDSQTGLTLTVSADISSILQETATPANPPVIRQNKWAAHVIVPFKKPTVLFSSDDATTKRQMQLELTVTPIL